MKFNTVALSRYLAKLAQVSPNDPVIKKLDDFGKEPANYTAKSISKKAQEMSGTRRKDMNNVFKEYKAMYKSMRPGASQKEIDKLAKNAVIKQAEEGNLTPLKIKRIVEEEGPLYRVPQTQELIPLKKDIYTKPTEIARIGDNKGPIMFGDTMGPETVESVVRPGVAQLKDPPKSTGPFSRVSGADDISSRIRIQDEFGEPSQIGGVGTGRTTYVKAKDLPGAPLKGTGEFVKRADMIEEDSLMFDEKLGILVPKGKTVRTVKGEQRSMGGEELDRKEFSEMVFDKKDGLLTLVRDLNKIQQGKEDKEARKLRTRIGDMLKDLANRKQGETKLVAKTNKSGKVLKDKKGNVIKEKKYVAFSTDNPKNWNQVVGGFALKDELSNLLSSSTFKNIVDANKQGVDALPKVQRYLKEVGTPAEKEAFDALPPSQPTEKSEVLAPLYKVLDSMLTKPKYKVNEKTAKEIGISRYQPVVDKQGNVVKTKKGEIKRDINKPYAKDDYIDLVINAIAKSEGKKRTSAETKELFEILGGQRIMADDVGQTYASPQEIRFNPNLQKIQRVRKDKLKEEERVSELEGTDTDVLADLDAPQAKDMYDEDVVNPTRPESGMVGSFSETGAGITALTPSRGGPDIKQLLGKYIKADDKKAYSKLSTEDKAIVQAATRTYRDTKKRLRQENKKFKETTPQKVAYDADGNLISVDAPLRRDTKGNILYPEKYSKFQIEDIAEQTALASVMQNINQAERSIFFSPEKMLKASDAELAAFLQPTEKDIGRGVTGPDFTQLDLQKPNVKIGTEELEAPFTTFKPLNVKEYTELLTGPPEVKAPVFNALNEFLKNPELYKDTIKQKEYLDILKDLMSTKLGLKKTKPTKKEQAALKKSTAKLNKVLKEINAKQIQRETIDTEELVEAPPAHFNIKKSPANLVTIVKKLERNKKLIREGFDDEVESLSPQEKELYNRAVKEGVIKKSNTGGLVSLKHRKKKSFIPKIIQNKKLKKRQQTKPKGVGAALRGYGAVCG